MKRGTGDGRFHFRTPALDENGAGSNRREIWKQAIFEGVSLRIDYRKGSKYAGKD